jgi:hypothetical protein
MGMVTGDRFLHFGYFSLAIGSLKPFDFFLPIPEAFSLA